MFEIAVSCLVITALLAYVNLRFIGLPMAIGVMTISLLVSLALVGLDRIGLDDVRAYEVAFVTSIDFSDVLMQGMLSLLLFAGALQVDLQRLGAYRWQVGTLAVVGTVASTAVVGLALWGFLPVLGLALPLVYCLAFGALISPTDPIAVMGILKSAKAPMDLEVVIAGESLFNDGVGVVLFSLLLGMIALGEPPTMGDVLYAVAREAGGGILLGLALGHLSFRMLKPIDSYPEEVLLTLAVVLGGYALARRLHVSGPLVMVIAGLVIGGQGRKSAMSKRSREYLDVFWELLDAILNAVLFVLIGMQALLIPFTPYMLVAGLGAIAITLAARLVTVGAPVALFRTAFALPPGSWQVLTWGGLRGGISVALALSLPQGPDRMVVLALTYVVVVFSILAQGLTIGRVVRSTTRAGR